MTNGERNPSTSRDQYGRELQPGRTSETTPSGTHAEYRQPVTDEGNGSSSTPEISADIERTRRKMGQRIDQIQAKLDPERLIDEAQSAVRDVLSDTASSITDYVRDNRDSITSSVTNAARRNPLPTALIGLGVGWLLLESLGGDSGSSRQPRSSDRRQDREYINRRQLAYGKIYSDPNSDAYDYDDDFDAASTGIYGGRANDSAYRERTRDQGQESGSGPLSKVKDTVSHVAETVKGQVENVKDQVEGMVQNVQQQAGDMGHRAEDQWSATGNRAQEMGGSMRRMTRRRGRQLQSSLEDNPLTYGALALAAGAVMAYLLPQTKMENQAVGRYRDQVVDEADEMMQEASTRVKEVVNEVRPELEQSAKAIGQELSQTVKQAGERVKEEINPVIEKAKEAAKDEARQAAAERGMGQGSQSSTAQGQGSQGQNQPLSAGERNKLQGQWHEVRGSVKQKWGKLTDDELTQIEGSYEKLSGALQRHYGHSQTQAEREIDEYLRQRK